MRLSFSKLSCFLNCPKAFELSYIRKLQSLKYDFFDFGSLIHKTIQIASQKLIADKYSGPLKPQLLTDIFKTEYPKYNLLSQSHFDEGLNILNLYVKNFPIFDYTAVLGIEQNFEIPFTNFTLNGFIDRIIRESEDTVEITDYKTSRQIPSKEEVDSNLQLSIYNLAAQTLYPGKKVRLNLYFVRHGIRVNTSRTPDQLARVKEFLMTITDKIKSTTLFPANINEFCNYCTQKNNCEDYKNIHHTCKDELDYDPANLIQVSLKHSQLSAIQKIIADRLKELEAILRAEIDQKGELLLNDRKYSLSEVKYTSYPIDRFLELFKDIPDFNLHQVLKVDNKTLTGELSALKQAWGKGRRLKDYLVLLNKLESIQEVSYTSRFNSKKIKDQMMG